MKDRVATEKNIFLKRYKQATHGDFRISALVGFNNSENPFSYLVPCIRTNDTDVIFLLPIKGFWIVISLETTARFIIVQQLRFHQYEYMYCFPSEKN
ncbi:unnamed protein product [Urochloa humidicola]